MRITLSAIFWLVCVLLCGQTTESEKLLKQAEEMVAYNPKESGTIAELIFKNAKDDFTRMQSLYISGFAQYLSGNYDVALNKLYQAKGLAEKEKNHSVIEECDFLIYRVLKFLNLTTDSVTWEAGNEIFRTEDFFMLGNTALLAGDFDGAAAFADLAKSTVNFSNPGYQAALYYGLQADILFNKKEFTSSLTLYQQAIEAAKDLDNPFLNQALYGKAAANYLVLDSLNPFHEYSEKSKSYAVLTSQIETRASNDAHRLNILALDKAYDTSIAKYTRWVFILLGATIVLLFIKLVFFWRNRKKLQTYERLLNYLRVQEEAIISRKHIATTIADAGSEGGDLAGVHHHHRSSSLLKESEERILEDLEKFEATHKFTHKDMSLSKLAAQLNTNTKYLSEVINRHKGKNFNSYINELRINYITNKIKTDPSYLKYKVSYLADECGYASHSTFTTVFKSIVGISPIAFVDFVKEELQEEGTAA